MNYSNAKNYHLLVAPKIWWHFSSLLIVSLWEFIISLLTWHSNKRKKKGKKIMPNTVYPSEVNLKKYFTHFICCLTLLRQCCLALGLMHPLMGMPEGLEHSMSVDWHQRLGFKSPRGQMGFSMMFHDKIML